MSSYVGVAKRIASSFFPREIPVPQLQPLDARKIFYASQTDRCPYPDSDEDEGDGDYGTDDDNFSDFGCLPRNRARLVALALVLERHGLALR